MNTLPRSQGIQIAADAAKKHAAPMCVVVTVDPTTHAVRVDSWGCNAKVCKVTAALADHLFSATQKWVPPVV